MPEFVYSAPRLVVAQQVILDVAQQVIYVWLIVLDQRGLPNDKLHEQKKVIHDGLFTWILLRHLSATYLEIYQEGSEKVVERWDLDFAYVDPEADMNTVIDDEGFWTKYLQSMVEVIPKFEALPPNTTYRVVVDLVNVDGKEPPDVKGWERTTLKSSDAVITMRLILKSTAIAPCDYHGLHSYFTCIG